MMKDRPGESESERRKREEEERRRREEEERNRSMEQVTQTAFTPEKIHKPP